MDFASIPGPRGYPLIGNLLDLKDEEAPLRALERMADIYGPIYQLRIGGKRHIIVSSAELMKEVMDEKRYMKTAIPGLHQDGRADGLIIAGTLDPDWEVAHRVLRPAFGPIQIEDMFDGMKDIAHQLVLKWARFGPDEEIAITEDFSNLTLDTIALCTMDFRFNSFYHGGAHPYVAAMNTVLGAVSSGQGKIPIISTALSYIGVGGNTGAPTPEQVHECQTFMQKTAQEIIDTRRAKPTRKNDFLNTLLFSKDPKTGQVMRDELIREQMPTFLIAGHETTSGLLSFAVIFLLQNPETYQRAQQEVDEIVGRKSITIQHIRDLKYISAILHETLRLVPTAPMISKVPHPHSNKPFETLGGKYKIESTDRVRLMLGRCMQDASIFGEDAREFKPDRMLPESNPDYHYEEKYWRPFSEGSRSCLGRSFSLQEAVLALALILQNFDLRLTDPAYKTRVKQTVTIKPVGLYVRARLRDGLTAVDLEQRLHAGRNVADAKPVKEPSKAKGGILGKGEGKPLAILYGSNQGTCQALAQRLASEVSAIGFDAEVNDMDAAVGTLSKEHPTIIITPSYEGEPPDNALQFTQRLGSLKGDELQGVKYAVFGCGHHDWHATFHRIPNLVNDTMKEHGAEQMAELGLSDVAKGNPMADFETWLDTHLLPKLQQLSSKAGGSLQSEAVLDIEADISTGERVNTLRQELQVGTVRDVKVLTAPGEQPEKRHMEVELPAGSTYECGDYLAILPQSPEVNVRAVMAHFRLPSDATIVLKSKIFAPLPLQTSLSVADLLRNYYELAKPTTRRGLSAVLRYTNDERVQKKISTWLNDDSTFQAEITEARTSLLSILDEHSEIHMPFPTFLSLLPPLSVRQYSISSSPLRSPTTCTITYSVLSDTTKDPQRAFRGVATTYLSTLLKGDRIQVATRRTAKQAFRLPLDVANTPLLMFAAGTGLAPFRGFIEQRAVQLEANPDSKLAPAYLFLGCRHSERDRLYAEEIDKWAAIGVVKIYYSFSQQPEKSNGCKYVADRMAKEIDTISEAWAVGARAYTCGNRDFAQSVGKAAKEIVENRMAVRRAENGWSEEQIDARRAVLMGSFTERAADDVFD